MAIQDIYLNPINPTALSFLGFRGVTDVEPFPHDIYMFLISAIRDADRDEGNFFLLRYLLAMQSEFEDTYGRATDVQSVLDPSEAPADALRFLRWIVGLTDRLPALVTSVSESDMRLLISIAARLWKTKGTGTGLDYAVKALTTYPARIVNYFTFRIIVDEVEIGRHELDVDPWLIDEPGLAPSVLPDGVAVAADGSLLLSLATLLGTSPAVPHSIRVKHVPSAEVRTVKSYYIGFNGCAVPDALGQATPSTSVNDYRVGVDPDEFVTDVRVVDDGTGVLNRTLLEETIRVLRPVSERVNVRYLDFQDAFRDALFWSTVTGDVELDADSGTFVLGDSAESAAVTDLPNDSTWTDVTATVQFRLRDATAGDWFEMRFNYVDASNFYALRFDPGTRLVSLDLVLAGARSTLDSSTLARYHHGLNYVLSVQVADTGAGREIKYLVDNNLLGSATDGSHASGKLGVAAASGQLATVLFAELFQNPLESSRIGPA